MTDVESEALALGQRIAEGPVFAHGITKTQLSQEWAMGLEQAIEAEAQAQAICMQTRDFERAYRAFVAKERPVFVGRLTMAKTMAVSDVAPVADGGADAVAQMPDVDRSFLDWPFFEDRHRDLAERLESWCAGLSVDHGDVDAACRDLVARLGTDGWLATRPGRWMSARFA